MTDNTECNIKNCKSVSLETGRLISELLSKTISQPYPSITEKDSEKLGKLLNFINQNCSIEDRDMKRINKFYAEIKNIYPTAMGSRQGPPLAELMDSIYNADSKCKSYK